MKTEGDPKSTQLSRTPKIGFALPLLALAEDKSRFHEGGKLALRKRENRKGSKGEELQKGNGRAAL